MIDDLLFRKPKRNKEDERERMGWKRTCCLCVNWEERREGEGGEEEVKVNGSH